MPSETCRLGNSTKGAEYVDLVDQVCMRPVQRISLERIPLIRLKMIVQRFAIRHHKRATPRKTPQTPHSIFWDLGMA